MNYGSEQGFRAGEGQDRWHSSYRDSSTLSERELWLHGYYVNQDEYLLFPAGLSSRLRRRIQQPLPIRALFERLVLVLEVTLGQILRLPAASLKTESINPRLAY